MSKLKQLKEKRASIYSQIDQLRTAADGREMTAEEQQRWDTLLADYNKVDKEVEAEERFEQIRRHQLEQAENTPAHTPEDRSAADRQYEEAFRAYLLSGSQGVTPEQRTLLQERAGLQGLTAGVLIPSTLAGSIEKALKSFGGMFEAGSIITTGNGGDLILPTINDTAAKATIVAEYAQSTKRTPSFSSVTLKAFTYRTPIIPVSQELLQDSAFNLDTILSDLLVESFGREHLTTGTGTGQPKGLVTAATAAAQEAAATAITLDNILDLIAGVDSAYAKNGKFMFNRNTLFALAKIKDNDGRFIWQDGSRVGLPSTLFGKSYVINDDMAGIGAGNASVLFGDLSKYKIRMVKSFRIIRLNELLAEYLSVGLFGFARLDGTLLDAGTHPVLKLVHAKA